MIMIPNVVRSKNFYHKKFMWGCALKTAIKIKCRIKKEEKKEIF